MSVGSYLESRNQVLYEKMARNVDAAKTLTTLVSNLVTMCNQRGCALKDLSFGNASISQGRLKLKINFSGGGYEPPLHHWSKDWMTRKNLRLKKAMDDNPKLCRTFGNVLSCLENYRLFKGKTSVKIESAIIDMQDNLVLTLK